MRGNSDSGAHVGSSSILMIFVILCLTTFAVLAMASAGADLRLTDKTEELVTSYYAADTLAEEALAQVDACLKQASGVNRQEYLDNCAMQLSLLSSPGIAYSLSADGLAGTYDVPINERLTLEVTIEVLYPPEDGARYRITSWKSVQTGDWIADDTLNLWSGEEQIPALAPGGQP